MHSKAGRVIWVEGLLAPSLMLSHHPTGLAGCMSPELSSSWPLAGTVNRPEVTTYTLTTSPS